jgi:hypothetical protein
VRLIQSEVHMPIIEDDEAGNPLQDLSLVGASMAAQGLVPLAEWVNSLKPPRTLFSARRWERAGKIVVRRLGGVRFLDVPATVERMRNGPQPQHKRSIKAPKQAGR